MIENENEERTVSPIDAKNDNTDKQAENSENEFNLSGREEYKPKEESDSSMKKNEGECDTYAFRWDCRPRHALETSAERSREARGGLLVGLIVSTVVVALLAIFALLLAAGSYRALARLTDSVGMGSGSYFERVVYVSAGNDNEEELAVEVAVARVLPSTVSILVEKEEGGSAVGSGVIYSRDGVILTNHHVVKNASIVKVRLYGGKEYTAELIEKDEQSDLALLKIEATDLIPAVFGDAKELLVGETVMAIGTPTGISYAESVSRGIISSVRRSVKIYDSSGRLAYTLLMVQTDASVNPGNSGGALLNRSGEVIGIVTNKTMFYDNGTAYYADGMGLAIPIDAAVTIAEDLLNGRAPDRSEFYVPASRLGVSGQYDASRGGVVVKGFTSTRFDSYLKLRIGDVIVAVNGKALTDINGLLKAIEDYAPGTMVRLSVLRGQERILVDVILGSDTLM